jgi:hypothetical protein
MPDDFTMPITQRECCSTLYVSPAPDVEEGPVYTGQTGEGELELD